MNRVSQRVRLYLVPVLVVFLAGGAIGCGDDATTATEAPIESPVAEGDSTQADETATPEAGDAEATPAGPISQERAEQIAVEAAGGGQATWSGREDERGAAWEVEVTRPDGSEVDVLIAADGSVVN